MESKYEKKFKFKSLKEDCGWKFFLDSLETDKAQKFYEFALGALNFLMFKNSFSTDKIVSSEKILFKTQEIQDSLNFKFNFENTLQ